MEQKSKYINSLSFHKNHLKDSIEDVAKDAMNRMYGDSSKEIEIYEIKLVKKVKIITGFEEVDLTPKVAKKKKK